MDDQEQVEDDESRDLEEVVEVEPEIVYFTEEGDASNIASLEQTLSIHNENSLQSSDGEILPVMPFDLSNSFIYVIEGEEIDLHSNDEASNSDEVSEDFIQDTEEKYNPGREHENPHCDICIQNFKEPKDLKQHYENVHVKNNRASYSCHICKKTFASSALLQAHDQSPCWDKKKIHCKECGADFSTTYLFSHHFKIEHEKKLVCVVCQKVHTSEAALLQHLQVHAEQKYFCQKCNVYCDTIYELITHEKTHSKTLLYACNKCDAEFSVVPDLAFHIRQQHGRSKKSINTS